MVLEDSGRVAGGKGGIRTLGTVARTRDFQSRTFGHSVTFPQLDQRSQPRRILQAIRR